MVDLWWLVAFAGLSVASGVLTGLLVVVLGGLGGIRTLSARLEIIEGEVADNARRITREQKVRAGEERQRGRRTDAELRAEAAELGSGGGNVQSMRGRSAASLGRRG